MNYPLLNAFMTMLWFFLWVMWFVLLFRIIGDIFRDDSMSGWGKAGWTIFVCVLPFLGCFVYNPRYGVQNGVDEIERYAKEFDFKMVQLQANMHAYRPDRALDWLRPAMKKCAELGLMVKVHTGDGPYSIPTEFYPIIREFPEINFILAHFGVQTGGVYVFEPMQMALDTPSVYVESGWCLQSRIVEFAKVLPKHKILYGSDTPPNEPGMWLRLLEVLCMEPPQGLNLDEDTLEDYLGNNVARMIGIEPTPVPRTVEEAKKRLAA